jgi:hypothetical protein
MRNIEKVHRSAAPNLLVQYPLAELTLQLTVDPSKSRRSIPARADGKSRRLIPTIWSNHPYLVVLGLVALLSIGQWIELFLCVM